MNSDNVRGQHRQIMEKVNKDNGLVRGSWLIHYQRACHFSS